MASPLDPPNNQHNSSGLLLHRIEGKWFLLLLQRQTSTRKQLQIDFFSRAINMRIVSLKKMLAKNDVVLPEYGNKEDAHALIKTMS